MESYRIFWQFVSLILLAILLNGCSTTGSGVQELANLPDNYQQIALLIPLNGPYAGPGKAVRNGFLAGFYAANRQGNTDIRIKIYDTSKSKDIRKLYAKAVAEGAQLVIGPLVKSKVRELAENGSIRVPTLTLNYVQDKTPPKKLFEFGISPQVQATQVATAAANAGLSKAIVIAPQANWGQQIVNAFTKVFESSGGKIVDSLYYLPKQNLRYKVQALLKVNLSDKRGKTLENILGEKVTFVPQRRKDFDMIFLVAPPASARQIMPLLRFYYAGKIPVYSISMVYKGTQDPQYYQDMDGITFTDIPWLYSAAAKNSMQQNLYRLWPDGYKSYVRLYALGLDTFKLTQSIKQLSDNPNSGLNFNTGQLYLGAQHQILQKFIFVKFINGRATPLS